MSKTPSKLKVASVYMRKAEYARLQRLAKQAGQSLSMFLLMSVRKYLEFSVGDRPEGFIGPR